MKKIKNLFFDLDGVIISSNYENAISYKDALKKFGYDENDYLKVYDAIDNYEKTFTEENNYYNRKELIGFINKTLNANYSYELMNEIIRSCGKWTKEVIISKEILEILYKEYNLYIYSNYFYECQYARIKNIGYDKYFKKIFCADMYGSKPFKSSFIKVIKELNAMPNECIMIGDTKGTDIKAANIIGMNSILYDFNGKRDEKSIKANNYIVVKNMDEELLRAIYSFE